MGCGCGGLGVGGLGAHKGRPYGGAGEGIEE